MAAGAPSYKEINAVVTAGTPAAIHTPASGKKFRLVAYRVSVSAAAGVLFKEGAANSLVLRTPTLAINTPDGERLGEGVPSAAADNVLKVDVTANATVTGWALVYEE
jgi:hypothetical protein